MLRWSDQLFLFLALAAVLVLSVSVPTDKQSSGRLSTKLQLSGFVLEEAEEQADLCVSGFLPETAHTLSEDTHRKPDEPRADEERGGRRTVRPA